jgi:hypothetical protein
MSLIWRTAPHRRGAQPERGFVMITMAAMTIGLVAFLGLAFDIGYLEWTRRLLQNAADSAANAGVLEVMAGSTNSVVVSAANADSSLNGYTNGVNGVTVTVNHPPLSGYSTGSSSAVEVIVSRNTPVYFLSIVGPATVPVEARAVSKSGGNGDCVFVLSPSAPQAWSLNGALNINLSCGAIVNSTSSSAMYLNGAINFTGQATVVGGYSTNGAITWSPSPPQTGAATQNDPLSYLMPPTVGACNYTNYSQAGSYSNLHLSPGVYCNGISFTGAGNIIFNPGTYILEGGGMHINGATNISGSGVSFYLTQGGGYTYGPVSIAGASNSTLTAATTGPLAGILFFQDRSIASPAASTIVGASNANWVGALYFPTSALTYSGASNGQYTILVAQTLTFNGAANVGADYSSLPGGSPAKGNAVMSE